MSFSKDPVFPAALAIVLALCLWRLTMTDAVTGDVAMYLQCGRLILDGRTIYVDFIDLNPPLVFFVSVLPAALAKFSGLPLLTCGSIACGALSILSLGLTAFVLKRSSSLFDRPLIGAFLLAISTIAAFVTYDFGQREHLLVLVWLPYFFLRFARANNNEQAFEFPLLMAVALGLLAGLGICFKPYFLLMPLALELSLLAGNRNFKNIIVPEFAGLIAAGVVYALGLFLLPEHARNYLFGYLMPLLSAGYSAFDRVDAIVVLSPVWIPTLSLVGLSLATFICWQALLAMKKIEANKVLQILSLSIAVQILVGFALIQIQHKGWCYHGIPMMSAALLLLALSLTQLAKISALPQRLQFCAAFITVLAAVVYSCFWLNGVHSRLHAEWEEAVPRLAPPGSRVAYLDTTDTPWFVQSAKHDIWPGNRYLWLFPVPIYENLLARGKVDKALVDKEMTALVTAIAADLEQYHTPLVVLKTTGCFGLPGDFNMQQYLNRYGLSGALSHYEQVERSGSYIFLRRISSQ